MEIKTKFDVGETVYAVCCFFSPGTYANYYKVCSVKINMVTYDSKFIIPIYYNTNHMFNEKNMFRIIEEAEVECGKRNREEGNGN